MSTGKWHGPLLLTRTRGFILNKYRATLFVFRGHALEVAYSRARRQGEFRLRDLDR